MKMVKKLFKIQIIFLELVNFVTIKLFEIHSSKIECIFSLQFFLNGIYFLYRDIITLKKGNYIWEIYGKLWQIALDVKY